MKLLLDTTVIIDVLRGRQERRRLMERLLDQEDSFAVSIVSAAEVFAGMRSDEEGKTRRFFATVELLPVDYMIAQRAGFLKGAYARRGITLGIPDMLIAATGIEHQLPLLTDNRRHFDLPDLTLFPLP